jgi:hypothetical protein
MKNYLNVVILGISAIICITILSVTFAIIKMSESGSIAVTGSATSSFTSDLIVWRGSFSKKALTSKEAYEKLKADTDAVKSYLLAKGVKESELVFSSIDMTENYDNQYNKDTGFTRRVFTGYTLTQGVRIESGEIDRVEQISRDITELIDKGIEFFSMSPQYYYTKLDEMKIGLISKATENARIRAEKIIEQSGGAIRKLLNASLGVFQITAENSSAEDYSYGGAFDVTSKNKTAFITIRLVYSVQ